MMIERKTTGIEAYYHSYISDSLQDVGLYPSNIRLLRLNFILFNKMM